jgi:antitoxin (DNA-binding transcriptional repressor) of toxin-antitoxin stability system
VESGDRGVSWNRSQFVTGCAYFSKAKNPGKLVSLLTQWTNWTNVAAMKTVNVHEAKTNFSSLLATVEDSSESFVICRNGEPVADLVPHKRVNRIKPHPILGKMKIKYDPIETATEAEWPRRFR